MAFVTAEKVRPRFARNRAERGSLFLVDPATGALVIRPKHRAKVEGALRRAAYHFAFRLYLRIPGIYFRLFAVKFPEARVGATRYFHRNFLKPLDNIHNLHPR